MFQNLTHLVVKFENNVLVKVNDIIFVYLLNNVLDSYLCWSLSKRYKQLKCHSKTCIDTSRRLNTISLKKLYLFIFKILKLY